MKNATQIKIIMGANEILSFRKKNKIFSEEKAISNLLDFLKDKKFNKYRIEILVGASKAIKMIEQNKNISDKEVVSRIVKEIPNMQGLD